MRKVCAKMVPKNLMNEWETFTLLLCNFLSHIKGREDNVQEEYAAEYI